MIFKSSWIGAAAIGCALFLAAPQALAADRSVNLTIGGPAQPAGQEGEDYKAVEAAYSALNAGGFPALEAHIPRLKAVLDRAPAAFPIVEEIGDTIVIRTDDDAQYLMLSVVASMPGKGSSKRSLQVVQGANTYPMAALAIGSYYNEIKQPQEALAYLERGLAMQANNPSLIGEKGASLISMRRFSDAVALYDSALASGDLALLGSRARYLRNRGVALIDLGRLDEAETSLKDAIKADPKDKIGVGRAKQELAYIKGLRAGGAPTGIQLQTRKQSEDAAAKAAADPK
jgi:Flp pilus assembly protein TadD